MKYISTRNNYKKYNFREVFIRGLAPDGGLYIPLNIPKYSSTKLKKMSNFSYKEIAEEILSKYCNSAFNKQEIKEIVKKAYSKFRVKNVVRINKFKDVELLELYHGPTLAFKDIAMQIIGNMYDKILKRTDEQINIIVATSGDTGSAAINAIKGKKKLNIFVLHPYKRISEVQRKFMTTTKNKNVFNLAIKGNFDNCQTLVKNLFLDKSFNKKINMSGVNSINWARIVAQVVYYFFCYFKKSKREKKINFSVPTGNFGDIFAGFIAKKMGLPINKLIIATNKNDILKRVMRSGIYKPKKTHKTISPSMDIQVASNFERLLFYLNSGDSKRTLQLMLDLKNKKQFKLNKKQMKAIDKDFLSESLSEADTKKVIKNFYKKFKVFIDPHTAIGIGVKDKLNISGKNIVLATAHASKFPLSVKKATGKKPHLPKNINSIMRLKENYKIFPNNINKVKKYILNIVES